MGQPLAGRKYDLRQPAGFLRLGKDAQAFGEELLLLAAVPAIAQRANPLDQRI